MESLFGLEMPTAGKVVIALAIVVGLLAGITWAIRRYGADHFGNAATRGRQPRLAVVDAAAVDGRRRLVIVRRDNVEHLLMIGGPTDVLVEANIVRAAGTAREKIEPTMTRPAAPADLRPGTAAESSLWPLQPQAENNQRAARTAATEEATLQWTAWPTQPEAPPPAPGRGEGFSGLTDDIGRAAAPREVAPSPRKPAATARSAPPV